jgi:phosphatidylserine/phosphatidylglycerophosphate/cardiolipin synthase-like enzyme
MSRALETWRRKLDYLQQQEGVASDPAQKFTLAEQIKEAQAKVAQLAVVSTGQPTRRIIVIVVVAVLVLLVSAAIAWWAYPNAPKIRSLTSGASFSVFARPERDGQIISRVGAGEQFNLLEGRGSKNWAFVRHRGKEGWVMAQDMSVVIPIEMARGLGFRGSYWQVFFTSPQAVAGQASEFGIDARFAQDITRSKTSLDIAVYELNNRLITHAILDAHARGVKVRIVTDRERLADKSSTIRELRQSGIAVVAKANDGGRYMHSKFAVIDQARVWTGSWNYTESGTFLDNDNVIAIESKDIAAVFAAKFQKLFDDGPERTQHSSAAAFAETSRLPHGVQVLFAPEDPTLDTLRAAFRDAKKSIRFMTYAITVGDMAEILQRQAAKGVVVRGIAERSSATSATAKSLLAATVPNLEVRVDGNPRTLRHNCVIIDDRLVFLGSMSISSVGATKNDENLLAIPDAALASKFTEEFERLWLIATKL